MKNQKGATLIMVLIVLLLVSAVATVAMKTGMFGLRLSTNNQVDNLLLENSNSALFSLGDPHREVLDQRLAINSVYGHFTSLANADDTLVFCYRANQTEFFNRASVLGDAKLGNGGFCTDGDFSGGRNAVISQVYVRRVLDTDDSTPLKAYKKGTDFGQNHKGITPMQIEATAISILPAFSNSARNTVLGCLGTRNTEINTVIACLKRNNVPYNLQHAEYSIATDFQRS